MHHSKSGIRYAKSLFLLAIERNELEAVSKDMQLIDSTIRENRDLENLLKSPIIKVDKKAAIMDEIFAGKLGKTTLAFIHLIIRKRREMFIDQIARHFVILYLENNNVEEALVITPFAMDDDFRKKITDLVLKYSTNSSVELEERIDPNLIGGFVLRFGDRQFDASVLREIEMLRREFDKNLYVKEY